jgi:hypothetical protein
MVVVGARQQGGAVAHPSSLSDLADYTARRVS